MESFARGKDLQLRTELSTLQHAMEVHVRREPKRDEDEDAQAPAGVAGGDTQAVDGAGGEADAAPDPFEVAHDLWCAEEERLKALIDLREKQQVREANNHQRVAIATAFAVGIFCFLSCRVIFNSGTIIKWVSWVSRAYVTRGQARIARWRR